MTPPPKWHHVPGNLMQPGRPAGGTFCSKPGTRSGPIWGPELVPEFGRPADVKIVASRPPKGGPPAGQIGLPAPIASPGLYNHVDPPVELTSKKWGPLLAPIFNTRNFFLLSPQKVLKFGIRRGEKASKLDCAESTKKSWRLKRIPSEAQKPWGDSRHNFHYTARRNIWRCTSKTL